MKTQSLVVLALVGLVGWHLWQRSAVKVQPTAVQNGQPLSWQQGYGFGWGDPGLQGIYF